MADPPSSDIVVTVLGTAITRDELIANGEYAVLSAVLGPLLDELRQQSNIIATEAEIDRFVARVSKESTRAEGRSVGLDDAAIREIERGIAEDAIVDWKLSKMLYERFGGAVIFQQFNPQEPVGAYLAFLREHEAKGSFEFYDDGYAHRFWDYFSRDHGHWVVDPDRVDYSKPWWEAN